MSQDAVNGARRHVLVVSDDERIREEARFGFAPDLEVALARDARGVLSRAADRAHGVPPPVAPRLPFATRDSVRHADCHGPSTSTCASQYLIE